MTSAFGNLITLLVVTLFSTIGFEQVEKYESLNRKLQNTNTYQDISNFYICGTYDWFQPYLGICGNKVGI